MCIVKTVSCRLCLSEQITEPYYFLLENKLLTDKYTKLLNLQTDLYDATIVPNHICGHCQTQLGKLSIVYSHIKH